MSTVPAYRLQSANGLTYLLFPPLERRGVKAAFSTRRGGVSPPPWHSLNLGLSVGDDPARVRENRHRYGAAAGLPPETWIWGRQVHGTGVLRVDGPARAGNPGEPRPAADILITARPGPTLVVFTADCCPIYLVDSRRRAIALVHAGWRGTVRAAPAAAVRALSENFAVQPPDLVAVIGPSIGPCCYEVDAPVMAALEAGFGARAAGLVAPSRPGRWRLDLWAANRLALERASVAPDRIHVTGLCTACRSDLFYSHRGERGKTGRMMALLALAAAQERH